MLPLLQIAAKRSALPSRQQLSLGGVMTAAATAYLLGLLMAAAPGQLVCLLPRTASLASLSLGDQGDPQLHRDCAVLYDARVVYLTCVYVSDVRSVCTAL